MIIIRALLLFILLPVAARTSDPYFKVTVSNVKLSEGNVVIALFNSEKDFLITPAAFQSTHADKNEITFYFRIPKKNYAITVYQDCNSNAILDKNWMGIPDEPVGFGNNYKPFGKPSYERCTVNF